MPRSWYYKVAAVGILVILSVFYLTPSLVKTTTRTVVADPITGEETVTIVENDNLPSWYPNTFRKYVNLGLDLQGGLLLVYSVDVDEAAVGRIDRWAADMEMKLKEEAATAAAAGTPFTATVKAEEAEAIVTFNPPTALANYMGDDSLFSKYDMRLVSRDDVSGTVVYTLRDERIDEIRKYAVEQALETISRRVDKLGVKEPSIAISGGTNIVIQLPGLSEADFESAKKLIDQVANLEFKIVDDDNPFMLDLIKAGKITGNIKAENERVGDKRPRVTAYLTAPTRDELEAFFVANPPPDSYEIGYEEIAGRGAGGETTTESRWRTYLLKSRVELTGEYLTDARPDLDQRENRPFVSIAFDAKGATIFENLTGEHVDERFGIILDNTVNSAPIIRSKIGGGLARIELGGFRSFNELTDEAKELAIVLQAGALPAPISKDFETSVGPQLGHESVRTGMISLGIGGMLVIAFLLFYYRGAGVIANMALMLNLLFLMGFMSLVGATLTLPGIQGIILTVGMAVDANVIIYERIREEVRLGKTPRAAVDAGFKQATRTVIDANLTTAIAAFVLLQFGSGPIKGFAVTLLVGIVSSVFTATVVARLLFDLMTRTRSESLSI